MLYIWVVVHRYCCHAGHSIEFTLAFEYAQVIPPFQAGMGWNSLESARIGLNNLEQARIGWNTLEYAGLVWNRLEQAGIGWNTLEKAGNAGIDWNMLENKIEWPELAGIC